MENERGISIKSSELPKLKESVWDLFLAFSLLTLGGVALKSTYDSGWDANFQGGLKQEVAKLSQQKGWVRFRSSASPFWRDITGTAPQFLGNGDVVFTGDDGTAVLSFDKEAIEVYPKSLIIIKPKPVHTPQGILKWAESLLSIHPKQKVSLDLNEGRIKLRLHDQESSVEVRFAEKTYDFYAQSPKAAVDLSVSQDADGRHLHAAPESDSQVEIRRPDQVARKVLQQTSSTQGEIIDEAVPIAPLAAPQPAPSVAAPVAVPQGKVEESQKSTRVSKERMPAPREKIEVLPTVEGESATGSTQIASSADLHRVSVQLRWKSVPGITKYDVSVFRPDGTVIQNSSVAEPHLTLELKSLDETDYFYDVSAALSSGKVIRSGRIPIRITLDPPAPVSPVSGETLSMGEEVVLTWKRTSLTTSYQLQIATDSRFQATSFSGTEEANFYRFVPLKSGKYYWRVKSNGAHGGSAWSSVSIFEMK
jgi:hypothetical protein